MIRRYYKSPPKAPKARFPELVDEAYRAWIRCQPCAVTGIRAGELIVVPFPGGKTGKVSAIIEAAHVKSRGAGGADHGGLIPLELHQHDLWHKGHKTYQRETGVDAVELARQYWKRYQKERPR